MKLLFVRNSQTSSVNDQSSKPHLDLCNYKLYKIESTFFNDTHIEDWNMHNAIKKLSYLH